jgi:hypothetical protein
LDKEYQAQQKQENERKRKEALEQKKVLEDMRQSVRERKYWEKAQEAEEDKDAQRWADFKTKQNDLRKEIEGEWFKYNFLYIRKSLQVRVQMGEHLQKERKAAQDLDQSIIEKQVEEANQKYLQELERKRAKMQQTNMELKQFRDLDRQKRLQQKENERDETQKVMESYIKDEMEHKAHLERVKAQQKLKQDEMNQVNLTMIVGRPNIET